MTLLFDKHQPIASPALVPIVDDIGEDSAGRDELAIALINNMPDAALKATERRFERLIQAAAGRIRIRFHCFSLPSVARSGQARRYVENEYRDIADDRIQRVGRGEERYHRISPAGCARRRRSWRRLVPCRICRRERRSPA